MSIAQIGLLILILGILIFLLGMKYTETCFITAILGFIMLFLGLLLFTKSDKNEKKR
jgi:cadmium resistance protein CadD (predicted permease)